VWTREGKTSWKNGCCKRQNKEKNANSTLVICKFATSSSPLSIFFSILWHKKAKWRKFALFNKNRSETKKKLHILQEQMLSFPQVVFKMVVLLNFKDKDDLHIFHGRTKRSANIRWCVSLLNIFLWLNHVCLSNRLLCLHTIALSSSYECVTCECGIWVCEEILLPKHEW
jgi:hypothetical protein